jgi:O-succinylbenzoate synthase
MDLSINFYEYSIDFQKPILVKNQSMKKREGLVFSYARNNSFFCFEAAPLPGFSKETVLQVKIELSNFFNEIKHFRCFDSLLPFYSSSTLFSIYCFLESLHQSERKQVQVETRKYIETNYDQNSLVKSVTNLIKSSQQDEKIKIKLGSYSGACSIELFKEILKAEKFYNKKIKWHLDFSQSLSKDEAFMFYEAFPLGTFYLIEDPIKNPLDLKELELFREHPLALDQTLRENELNFLFDLSSLKSVEIKPTMDIKRLFNKDLRKKLKNKNCEISLSSSYESSIGLGQMLYLPKITKKNYTMGIDTFKLFTSDTSLNPLYFEQEKVIVPKITDLNLSVLTHYDAQKISIL